MDIKTRTILVVDSSASMLFYLGLLLQRLEYRVVTARSGEDALRMMNESMPVIVLTEVALPAMSGVALLKQIKDSSASRELPVIMLTAEDDPEIKETCMRMGCAAYLHKPAVPDVLYRTIQTALEFTPRTNIRLRTSLKVVVGDGSIRGGAVRTENVTAISEGGLFIRTRYPQPRNAVIPLRILMSNREIVAIALVLYSYAQPEGPFNEPGMAMKFTPISDEDRALVRQFIREELTHDIA